MQPELFNQQFNTLFRQFGNEADPGMLKLEADFYKKLWNYFLIGDSYHFILNHHTLQFEFVSKEIKNVLGYEPGEFTVQFMNALLHPEDVSFFLSMGSVLIDFFSGLPLNKLMKYKVRYDVRYKKYNGDYIRILYQGIMLQHDEQGRIFRTLGVHTDITYLKAEGKPALSFIGIDDEPSYVDVTLDKNFLENKQELTRREKQILKLLIQGRLSKEISSILNISKQTVDTHRKNMLHKNNLSNTGELIGKALKHGWI